MPIVNCYSTKELHREIWDQFVHQWSEKIGVDQKDITIHIFTDFLQAGEPYTLKVELYLPSLWSNQSINAIQQSFLSLTEEFLGVKQNEVFLMTLIVQSGHVIDRGSLARW